MTTLSSFPSQDPLETMTSRSFALPDDYNLSNQQGGRGRSSSSATLTGTGSAKGRRFTGGMNRYSVNAVYSMAAEQDVEVEDELARGEFLLFSPSSRVGSRSLDVHLWN
jgi:hypothetical protein